MLRASADLAGRRADGQVAGPANAATGDGQADRVAWQVYSLSVESYGDYQQASWVPDDEWADEIAALMTSVAGRVASSGTAVERVTEPAGVAAV